METRYYKKYKKKSYMPLEFEKKYLTSSDLDNIKTTNNKKKVLLINPKKAGINFMHPHNGLAILAGILKKRGHEVLIVDYPFLIKDRDKDISFFINMFKPDIIGISIYTPSSKEADEMTKRIKEIFPKIPLIVGGAHASTYPDILQKNKNIDYIFIGEAELTIIPIVENAKKEEFPKIIKSKEILNLYHLPLPDYKSFYGWQTMTTYSIMTSRGCPYKCSFCTNIGLKHRMWRPRKPEECIKELELAKKEISPNLKFAVFDDCPTVDKKRFHKFLELYIEKIKNELAIVNTRADSIDEDFVKLCKKCNVRVITIGVEHGNLEVFKMINKGETFEQIEKACKLIKKHGVRLGVSFIIGLPGDTLEKTMDSINFYKKLRAEQVSLNIIVPFRNTLVREWLDKNNIPIDNEFDFGDLSKSPLECPRIMFETPEFTKFEREKAFYTFLFGAVVPVFKIKYMPKMIPIIRKYSLYLEFIYWLPRRVVASVNNNIHVIKYGFNLYKNNGFKYLLNRLFILKHMKIV